MRNWIRAIGIAAILALGACARGPAMVKMTTTPDNPAAEGVIKATEAANENTAVEVLVKHLAPPERVSVGATTYVVWTRPFGKNGEAQNMGALRVNDDLQGQLTTVTPHRSFELFITAEPSATVQAPTSKRLLSANIQRDS